MIIPIRCFTCGEIIADKWLFYENELKKVTTEETIINVKSKTIKTKTPEGKILDHLEVDKYCCRRMFLGHVDIN